MGFAASLLYISPISSDKSIAAAAACPLSFFPALAAAHRTYLLSRKEHPI